jgi:8-oxo-dGTP pyrophosphatase MutT (NUDIX family)
MASLSAPALSSSPATSVARPGTPEPRRAASVVVVRPLEDDFEVLMLLRASNGDQNSGAWVFPGGVLEPSDDESPTEWIDPGSAPEHAQSAASHDDVAFRVAAARECLEEAGVIPGLSPIGDSRAIDLSDWQREMNGGNARLQDLCTRHDARIDLQRWRYFAHWLTPPGMPKRFDTRFFLVSMNGDQEVRTDGREIVDHAWLRIEQLLDARSTRRLLGVTREILTTLRRRGGFSAVMGWAASLRDVPLVMRRRCTDRNGPCTVMPDHPAWHEIGLLDPEGRGDLSCEWPPKKMIRLSQRVWRVMRRDTGTNLYWIGDPDGWFAVTSGRLPPSLDQPPQPGRIVGVASRGSEFTGTLRITGDIACTLTPAFDLSTRRPIGVLLAEDKTLFTFDDDATWQLPGGVDVKWIAPPAGFIRPARQ